MSPKSCAEMSYIAELRRQSQGPILRDSANASYSWQQNEASQFKIRREFVFELADG
jgi:hypothetical protein